MQQQGSVSRFMAHITIKDHMDIPSAWNHVDIQGQCRAGLALTDCSIWENRPWTSHVHTIELALVVWVMVSWSKGRSRPLPLTAAADTG